MWNNVLPAPVNSWFWFSLAAFFFMGLQGFLYKVAAEKRCDTALTTFVFMSISFALWMCLREPVGNLSALIMLALINSLSFLVATMTFIETLKYIPAATAFSFARLNLVTLTVFSIAWFHDRLSPYQISGIMIALAAMVAMSKGMVGDGTRIEHTKRGAVFLIVSLFASAIAGISSKFAAMSVCKLSFLAIVYAIAALCSLVLTKKPAGPVSRDSNRTTLIIGVAMGILNFFGYYAFLSALSQGPLSLVASITGMHFVVSVVLSVLIFKEHLTVVRIIGFFLTILSIILLRLE